jgi:hypothetical protein
MSSSSGEDDSGNSKDTAAAAAAIERLRSARGAYSDGKTLGCLRTDGDSSGPSAAPSATVLSTDCDHFSAGTPRGSKGEGGSDGYFTDADYYAWLGGSSRGSTGKTSAGVGGRGHDRPGSTTAKESDMYSYGFSIAPLRETESKKGGESELASREADLRGGAS